MPPKVYHASHEPPPEQMSDHDKAVNDQLAGWLFDNVLKGKPGPTLDIGAAYPYLASRLEFRGCDARAQDAEIVKYDLKIHSIINEDFEQSPPRARGPFELVTLIHSFEHMYRPVEALRKLRRLVADDGRVFIRSPDHNVAGYERDLTPGHYTIHPFYHTLTSILQLCVEAGDAFEIEQHYALQPGQSDMVLRPIKRKPRLNVGIIARNESRDLPRALASLGDAPFLVYLSDTGSTDDTAKIAIAHGCVTDSFLEASDEQGRIQDFAKARNHVIEQAEMASFPDWYMWLDADDVLVTPDAIRRATYWTAKDCFKVWIDNGGPRWTQHRMWKTAKGVRFAGRVHEYPILDGMQIGQLNDALIVHHADPHPGEDSNARNLRILTAEWEDDPSRRTAFYIAQTHKDAGRNKEAIEWYQKRIDMGQGYRDEWLFAWLYRVRCQRALGDDSSLHSALYGARGARNEAPAWMEFRMEVALIFYQQGKYAEAIEAATPALDAPIPPTELWRETNMYRDQPARLISWCHEHLGNTAQALEWAKVAKEKIGVPDAEWDARIARLEKIGAPAIIGKAKDVICLRRAGGIGDVLMTLNLLPALKEANPDCEIWYFTDRKLMEDDALGWIIRESGADKVYPEDHFEPVAKEQTSRAIDLVGYPLAEGYPEKPMRKHLLQYFADEIGLLIASLDAFLPENERLPYKNLPALTLRRPLIERIAGNYVTVQPKAGWSKYKQWPLERWQEVYRALPDVNFFVFDEAIGKTLSDVIAIFANARMHIGVDSFCNHLTNYIWTDEKGFGRRVPGVILWGSTQASAAGYPHNTNISLGLPCQPCFRENPAISRMPRGPCINPPRASYDDDTPWKCMRDIRVEQVVEAVRDLWNRTDWSVVERNDPLTD